MRLEPIFILIMKRFRDFVNPNTGEKFSNTFVTELLVGQFALAYQRYITQRVELDNQLAKQRAELTRLRGLTRTPVGHEIDAADLKVIDDFIRANGGSTQQIAPPPQAKPQGEPATTSAPVPGVPIPEAPPVEGT